MRKHERGNALFLILLGVALFGALSYAVSQGFRGSNERLSAQRTQALAIDIISSAAGVEKAIQKMQARGLSESRISFNRASGDGYELAPVSTSAEKVFNISGGGVVYIPPAKEALDATRSAETAYGEWIYTSTDRLHGVGSDVDGVGTGRDLYAMLPYVRKEVCILLNQRFGVTNPAGIPPKEGSAINFNIKFTGFASSASGMIETVAYYTAGKKAACFEGNLLGGGGDISGRYYFYYTLLPR